MSLIPSESFGEVFDTVPASPQDRLPADIIRNGYCFHDKLPWGTAARSAAAHAFAVAAVPIWPDQEYATLKYHAYDDIVHQLRKQVDRERAELRVAAFAGNVKFKQPKLTLVNDRRKSDASLNELFVVCKDLGQIDLLELDYSYSFKKEKLLEEFIAQGFPISRFNWLIKAAFTEFAKKPSLGKSKATSKKLKEIVKDYWFESVISFIKMFLEKEVSGKQAPKSFIDSWQRLFHLLKWQFDDGLLPKSKFLEFICESLKISAKQNDFNSVLCWLYACSIFVKSISLSRVTIQFLFESFSAILDNQSMLALHYVVSSFKSKVLQYSSTIFAPTLVENAPIEHRIMGKPFDACEFVDYLDGFAKSTSKVSKIYDFLRIDDQKRFLESDYCMKILFEWSITDKRHHFKFSMIVVHQIVKYLLMSNQNSGEFVNLFSAQVLAFLDSYTPKSDHEWQKLFLLLGTLNVNGVFSLDKYIRYIVSKAYLEDFTRESDLLNFEKHKRLLYNAPDSSAAASSQHQRILYTVGRSQLHGEKQKIFKLRKIIYNSLSIYQYERMSTFKSMFCLSDSEFEDSSMNLHDQHPSNWDLNSICSQFSYFDVFSTLSIVKVLFEKLLHFPLESFRLAFTIQRIFSICEILYEFNLLGDLLYLYFMKLCQVEHSMLFQDIAIAAALRNYHIVTCNTDSFDEFKNYINLKNVDLRYYDVDAKLLSSLGPDMVSSVPLYGSSDSASLDSKSEVINSLCANMISAFHEGKNESDIFDSFKKKFLSNNNDRKVLIFSSFYAFQGLLEKPENNHREEVILSAWILVIYELFRSFTRFFVIEQYLSLLSEESALFSIPSPSAIKIFMRGLAIGVFSLKQIFTKLKRSVASSSSNMAIKSFTYAFIDPLISLHKLVLNNTDCKILSSLDYLIDFEDIFNLLLSIKGDNLFQKNSEECSSHFQSLCHTNMDNLGRLISNQYHGSSLHIFDVLTGYSSSKGATSSIDAQFADLNCWNYSHLFGRIQLMLSENEKGKHKRSRSDFEGLIDLLISQSSSSIQGQSFLMQKVVTDFAHRFGTSVIEKLLDKLEEKCETLFKKFESESGIEMKRGTFDQNQLHEFVKEIYKKSSFSTLTENKINVLEEDLILNAVISSVHVSLQDEIISDIFSSCSSQLVAIHEFMQGKHETTSLDLSPRRTRSSKPKKRKISVFPEYGSLSPSIMNEFQGEILIRIRCLTNLAQKKFQIKDETVLSSLLEVLSHLYCSPVLSQKWVYAIPASTIQPYEYVIQLFELLFSNTPDEDARKRMMDSVSDILNTYKLDNLRNISFQRLVSLFSPDPDARYVNFDEFSSSPEFIALNNIDPWEVFEGFKGNPLAQEFFKMSEYVSLD